MDNLMNLTALQLAEKIHAKQISVVEATEATINAIEQKDGAINAVITIDKENALRQAAYVQERIDKGIIASKLAGVPILIKDNICTTDLKTTCASKILGEFVPPYDATVIKRLKAADMIIVGKTNMDEFAMGSTTETSYYGVTKNPVNTEHVPGGSSGGSAAAVAAEEVFCALGSDTGGSIRQPASYCGVTGFKPTYGTVSRFGLIAYASSLDQIGPIAKDTKDCVELMDIIKGKDEFDGTSLNLDDANYSDSITGDIRGLRIALPNECFGDGIDPEIEEKVLGFVDDLVKQGAEVERVDMSFLKYVVPAYYIMATAEASSNLSRFDGVKYGFRASEYEGLTDLYDATRSEGFGDEVKKRILLGTFVLSSGYYDAYYRKALKVKAIIKKEFDSLFEKYDVVVMPTSPCVAPKLGESLSDPMKMYLSDIYTVSANIAGLPGLSIPCGQNKEGMPIGVQVIGQRLGDAKVLNVGVAYQSKQLNKQEG